MTVAQPTLRRPELGDYDPDAAGDASASVFGLPFAPSQCSLRLLGVPWEATTSYGRGTVRGPVAISGESAQLDLFDLDLVRLGLAKPWAFGIHLEQAGPEVVEWNSRASRLALPVIDAGGAGTDPGLQASLAEVNALSRQLDAWVQQRVGEWLDAGHLVGVVGGDHSVPLGALRALGTRHPGFGILHVDAHADLRVAYEGFEGSHASIMHNVLEQVPQVERIVQVGIRDQCEAEWRRAQDDLRIRQFTDAEARGRLHGGESWKAICNDIVEALPPAVYVSFDIDGLEPSLCPHTGTPVPGGLNFGQAVTLLMAVLESGRHVIGFDLCEVSPALTSAGELDTWDANVGARVLYKLCGATLHGAGARDPAPPSA